MVAFLAFDGRVIGLAEKLHNLDFAGIAAQTWIFNCLWKKHNVFLYEFQPQNFILSKILLLIILTIIYLTPPNLFRFSNFTLSIYRMILCLHK